MTDADFYNNIEKWIEEDLENWNRITLVAYFCYKYQFKNKNNPAQVPFRLTKSRNNTFSSKELADLSKLFNMFAPDNFSELPKDEKKKTNGVVNLKIRNYINWMFDWKFRSGTQSVNGTRIFLQPSMIVEFERVYVNYLNKQKNGNKLELLVSWCRKETPEIFKRHQLNKPEDLQIIKKYAEQYCLNNDSVEIKIINKAIEIGLLTEKK